MLYELSGPQVDLIKRGLAILRIASGDDNTSRLIYGIMIVLGDPAPDPRHAEALATSWADQIAIIRRLTKLEEKSEAWPNVRNMGDLFARLERLETADSVAEMVVRDLTALSNRIDEVESVLGDDPLTGEKPPLLHRVEAIEQQLMEP